LFFRLAFRTFGIRKVYRDFSLVKMRHFLLSILSRLAYQFPSPSVGEGILSGSTSGTSSSFRSFRVQWMILMYNTLTFRGISVKKGGVQKIGRGRGLKRVIIF